MPNKRLLLCTAIAAVASVAPHNANARQLAITVRNQPIHAAAIVQQGHVMLPLRVTFESLNSSVWYDGRSGIITARNILHVLHLKVGSSTALLDGRAVNVTPAPQLVHGSVYVPVAFAAQAMGAIIRYDAATNALAVNGSQPVTRAAQPAATPNAVAQSAYPITYVPVYTAVPPGNAYAVPPQRLMNGPPSAAMNTRTAMAQNVFPFPGFNGGFPFFNSFPPGVVTGGVTIVGPPAGNGYGPAPAPFVPFLPFNGSGYGQVFISNIGGSGIILTGDPLHPLGQYPTTQIVNPFFPFRWP